MHLSDQFYFDVPQPERLSRLLIFVKWLLVLPHLFVLYLYGIAAGVIAFCAWFIIFVNGRYPEGMWNFVYSYQRWSTRVSIYNALLRDEYPPFGEAPYPMEYHLDHPDRSSRLLLIGRIVLMIPLVFWLAVLGMLQALLHIFAWFAILITGNIPQGTFTMLVGIMRYTVRVNSYSFLLTDQWPGFSLKNPDRSY